MERNPTEGPELAAHASSAAAGQVMPVYRVDALQDPRWEQLVRGHSRASVFHTPAWLRALRQTYGYQPVVFTTSPPHAALTNGIVFAHVRSFLTGARLVSLPFADHCRPLTGSTEELHSLLAHLQQVSSHFGRYFELRCVGDETTALAPSASYAHHTLDLRPSLDSLFQQFHKSCVQRKIRRAEREALAYEEGASDQMLRAFYSLMVLTRRRHGIPPQPSAWFFHLRDCFGEALQVRVISKEGRPIAGILTIRHQQTLVYKYGASDARFHNLGAMPLLFWRTIQEAKSAALQELDLGRSDFEDQGLIEFKEHLGATRSTLNYYRYPPTAGKMVRSGNRDLAARLFAHLPDPLFRAAGKLLYRHMG